ncbi:hypothetical protein Aduo_006688 [Ancylostoma duodenale]
MQAELSEPVAQADLFLARSPLEARCCLHTEECKNWVSVDIERMDHDETNEDEANCKLWWTPMVIANPFD